MTFAKQEFPWFMIPTGTVSGASRTTWAVTNKSSSVGKGLIAPVLRRLVVERVGVHGEAPAETDTDIPEWSASAVRPRVGVLTVRDHARGCDHAGEGGAIGTFGTMKESGFGSAKATRAAARTDARLNVTLVSQSAGLTPRPEGTPLDTGGATRA